MVLRYAKTRLMAKSFDTGQPARTAQADQSRYFLQIHYGPLIANHGSYICVGPTCITYKDNFICFCLFVWGFTPYQQYFSYLTAKVHKSMFPGLFCLGFYAVSTVFQLFNGDSSLIHVSYSIFNQSLTSPLS